MTDTYDYLAFGELLNSSGTTENSYLFAGEQYDPNSRFYYLRARWMDPETGRFVSTDPFEGINADPVSLHKYLYAGANPVMYVDPSGEVSLMRVMVTLSISSFFSSEMYSGYYHLISKLPPITWDALSTLVAYNYNHFEGAYIHTIVTTKHKKEKTYVHHEYIESMIGLTEHFPEHHAMKNFDWKSWRYQMITPGTFGYGYESMSGLSYYASIGYTWGIKGHGAGVMFCKKNMGVGYSTGLKLPIFDFVGAYRGMSYLFGWSAAMR